MAEPFKHVFNTQFVEKLILRIQTHYPKFNSGAFTREVFDDEWEGRELKQRMRHISLCLRAYLPEDLSDAFAIIREVASDFGEKMDIAQMVFPDFVEHFGLTHPDSLDVLKHLTCYSSSEFAVRPFIANNQAHVMALLQTWAASKNYHVRRCASECCRPRLPWAMALPALKVDPSPIIPILDRLKNDPELYVRRSVANNLNDIAKDNPAIVIALAQKWLGQSKNMDWVVKHGCRTLLKQANPDVLALFGYAPPLNLKVVGFNHQASVAAGQALRFSFTVEAINNQVLGKLRLEFAIDFMKANGKQARKIFQISEGYVAKAYKSVTKNFSFKPITTRKYYQGEHGLAILVNGQELAKGAFTLLP